MADVFISYKSESALTLVSDVICPAIEAAGFACWYAKRDMKPGAYPGQIKRAIGNCRVFLLILENPALNEAHIKSETALAYRRLVRHEPMTLLPFRVDECDVQEDDDLDYYLISQQVLDGSPPDSGRVQELVDRISEILSAPR